MPDLLLRRRAAERQRGPIHFDGDTRDQAAFLWQPGRPSTCGSSYQAPRSLTCLTRRRLRMPRSGRRDVELNLGGVDRDARAGRLSGIHRLEHPRGRDHVVGRFEVLQDDGRCPARRRTAAAGRCWPSDSLIPARKPSIRSGLTSANLTARTYARTMTTSARCVDFVGRCAAADARSDTALGHRRAPELGQEACVPSAVAPAAARRLLASSGLGCTGAWRREGRPQRQA